MTSVPKAKDFKSANPRTVVLGTLLGLAVSAIPFAFKTVRDREANVHAMREGKQVDQHQSDGEYKAKVFF